MTSSTHLNAVFIMVRSFDPYIFKDAAKSLSNHGIDMDAFAVRSDYIDDNPVAYDELCKRTCDADLVLIHCSGRMEQFHRFERYKAVLEQSHAMVLIYSRMMDETLLYRGLFSGTDSEYSEILKYLSNRGPENDRNLLLWFARRFGATSDAPDPPIVPRTDGVYHPDLPRDISLKEYIDTLDADRPCVGIAIASNYWLYDNLAHIDLIIEGLEKRGIQTIPFFFAEAAFDRLCSEEGTDLVTKYLTRNGTVFIDLLVVFGTSIVSHSRSSKGVRYSDDENVFHTVLDVPVLLAIAVRGDYSDYESDRRGLDKHDLRASSVGAELEGEIITVPVAYTPFGNSKKAIPIPERIDHLCNTAYAWIRLRRKKPSERRVAILLLQPKSDLGCIGKAAGLDGCASVASLMARMKADGYLIDDVPIDGDALVHRLLDGVTNDLEPLSDDAVLKKSAATMSPEEYGWYYSRVPEWDREMIEGAWGSPANSIVQSLGCFPIPGFVDGNIFVGFQPLRGMGEKMEQDIHDPFLFTPHQYLALYRWVKFVFKADAIIHMGTHGSLEWLPGKNMGLSEKCNPDVSSSSVPIIYPFVIDDPGEGIQPKRRTESIVIGHMPPTMTRAGSYDSIDEVDTSIQDYLRLRHTCSDEQRAVMVEQIYSVAKRNNFLKDLNLNVDSCPDNFEEYIVQLHEIVDDLKDSLIPTDLHILGKVPEGCHLDETVYSLMRYDNGDVPSLRDAFFSNVGLDINVLLESPSEIVSGGELNSVVLDRVENELMDFITAMREFGYDQERCLEHLRTRYGSVSSELEASVNYVVEILVPNILRMGEEIGNIMSGLSGRYVLPGPSGVPSRGGADILPMGRNFYSLDPATIPKRSAWEIGRRMADQMVEQYKQDRGAFPREVGFIIWATDTIKTGGDDLSYILWLMGVRPIWSTIDGEVTGLEVVPLEELGRPRIDVTINITGMFRDAFPALIDLLNDAFDMVAKLDEADEDNAITTNFRKDVARLMSEGIKEDEARMRSSVRMFGAPPGGYGTGVNQAVSTGSWSTLRDLADIYMDWCSNAYSRCYFGIPMKDEFIRHFSNVDATVKNTPDRDYDVLNCDDYYEFLGGMNAFVKAYGTKDALSIMGDSSDTKRTKVRYAQDEIRHVYRSKIMNPKYLKGLKEHGYRGAAEISSNAELLLGWSATSGLGDDWMFQDLADRFVFNEENMAWMESSNPSAAISLVARLLEAIERGLWNAPDGYKDRLKEAYLEVEGVIEEGSGL